MEETTRKLIRREGNTQGGALLVYMGIMNAAVIVLMVISTLMQMFALFASDRAG